jgi:hypothetical protein
VFRALIDDPLSLNSLKPNKRASLHQRGLAVVHLRIPSLLPKVVRERLQVARLLANRAQRENLVDRKRRLPNSMTYAYPETPLPSFS